MFFFLSHIIKPSGKIPLIGDFDDGKVLLLTNYKKYSHIDLINLGSILFQKGTLKHFSKKISPISILLLGTKGIETFNKLTIQEPKLNFKFFKNGGYFLIRNNWSDKSNYLFVDFGRFGAINAGHSHSNVTNFIFSYKGKDIIVDSGTFNYNKSLKERNYFRSSKAHNVLTIDEKNQAKIKSIFAWENKPKIKRKININGNRIELVCFHDGCKGFLIKRKIITNKELNQIIIIDTVFLTHNSKKPYISDINIYFHFSKDCNISVEDNDVRINNELLIKIASIHDYDIKIKKSYYSPRYGYKCENLMLDIHSKHSFEKKNKFEIKTEIRPIS